MSRSSELHLNHWPAFVLAIFLWLLLWWLCYWPGIISYDGINYINSAVGGQIDSLHSHFYSLLILLLIHDTGHITPLIGLQIALAALVMGRCAAAIMLFWRHTDKWRWLVYLWAAFVIFSPLTIVMSIEYISDDGFSFAFIGLLFELWWLAFTQRKSILPTSYLLILFYIVIALLFRANGIILALLLPLLCALIFSRKMWWQINGTLLSIAAAGMLWSAFCVQGARHPMIFPFAIHSTATIIQKKGAEAISPEMRQALEAFTTIAALQKNYAEKNWLPLILSESGEWLSLDDTKTQRQITRQFFQQELWQHFATVAKLRWRIISAMARASYVLHHPRESKIIMNALAKEHTQQKVKIVLDSPLPEKMTDLMHAALLYSRQSLKLWWNGFPGLGISLIFFGWICLQTFRFRKLPPEALLFVPLCANTAAVMIFSPAAEYRYWFPTTLAVLPGLACWGAIRWRAAQPTE